MQTKKYLLLVPVFLLLAFLTSLWLACAGSPPSCGIPEKSGYLAAASVLYAGEYPSDSITPSDTPHPPIINSAFVEPLKVRPGDSMLVAANISDPSGVSSVYADMGGIETVQLFLKDGTAYSGVWENSWLVHGTEVKNYTTRLTARNLLGLESYAFIGWSDPVNYIVPVNLNSTLVNPGETVEVSGTIFNATNTSDVLENNSLEIYLDGQYLALARTMVYTKWSYRKPIIINGSNESLSDYLVNFTINWTSGMNLTFDDLRFTYYNSTSGAEASIPYWIQSNVSGVNATVWIKTNLTVGENTVYLYYGNTNATSASNESATFYILNRNFDYLPSGRDWSCSVGGPGACDAAYAGDFNSGPNSGYVYETSRNCVRASLQQQVTLPDIYPLYLHYWRKYWHSQWGGPLAIKMNATNTDYYSGTLLTDWAWFTATSAPWEEFWVNISDFRGQTVLLEAVYQDDSTNDPTWCNAGDHGAWMRVDDFFISSTDHMPSPVPSLISMGPVQGITAGTNSTGGYFYSFTAPQTAGIHTIRVNFTDHNGTAGENSTNFTVRVGVNGQVVGAVTGTNHIMQGQNFSILAVVQNSTNGPIDSVWMNLTRPNGSSSLFFLANRSSRSVVGIWSLVFNISDFGDSYGNYTVVFYANDTTGVTQQFPAPAAAFFVQYLTLTGALFPDTLDSGEYASVSGQGTLMPGGSPAAGGRISVFLDGLDLFSANWWNSSFSHRRRLLVNGSNVSLADYQLKLELNWTAPMDSDFSDLRFTSYKADMPEVSAPYWIENYVSGVNATVWVKANLTNGNNNIYLYYGNSGVSGASNGSDVPWRSGPCTGFNVYRTDEPSALQWKTSNTACITPQCGQSGGQNKLVASNTVDFADYPARDACKMRGGRLPTPTELSCIFTSASWYGSFQDNYYWSATEYSDTAAQLVYSYGGNDWDSKSSTYYVRCVRDEASPAPYVLSIAVPDYIIANSSGGYHFAFSAPPVAGIHNVTVNMTDVNGIYGAAPPSVLMVGQMGPPSYDIKTFLNGTPESFFAGNETIEVRAVGAFQKVPFISITSPSGVLKVSNQYMLNTTSGAESSFSYNYTINGSSGWWNVSINRNVLASFYVGPVWSGWSDAGGHNYPFRLQFNVTEPNSVDRFFEPVDVRLNFTFGAHNTSVRVLQVDGPRLIEVPSQVYGLNQTGERVGSANVVFIATIGRNSTKEYYAYYSRSDIGVPAYPSDLAFSNQSSLFGFENAYFRIFANGTAGGVLASAFNKAGSGVDLAGLSPMQQSPSVFVPPKFPYSATDLPNPFVSIQAGNIRSVFSASGTVGTMDYWLRYTFFSHTPYFILETNVTARTSEIWDPLKNHHLFLSEGVFSALSWRNSSGIYAQPVSAGAGPDYVFGAIDWISFLNNNTGDSLSDVFLGASPVPQQSYFYDSASYDYYEQRQKSGSVSAGDSFYSRVARVLGRMVGNEVPLNDTYLKLSNPVGYSFGSSETSDSAPPVFSIFNQTPFAPADTDNITCFSKWMDNLEIDYAVVRVNSSGYNAGSAVSVRSNDTWVNFTIPAAQAEAGLAWCNITAFDIAGLSNSTAWSFSISDNTPPVIIMQSNFPSSAADLDPNVTVNVSVNITEYTNVSSVVLQYRSNDSGWSNVSMSGANTSAFGYYFTANFTPGSEGVWSYRVFANDTLGNSRYGNETNLSVYYDWTWALSPQDFGAKSVLFNKNVTLGGLFVNNTGDLPLSFRITSNWDDSRIFFNNTAQGSGYYLTLPPGNFTNLSVIVGAVATAERSDSLTITVDALNSSAHPDIATSNATIVSYAGGPFLLLTIDQYNSSASAGDSGLLFKVKVQNKGNESASGVYLRWSLPAGVTLSSGDLVKYVGTLSVDAIALSTVFLDVPDSTAGGSYTVSVSANSTQNKTGAASVSVAVTGKSSTVIQTVPGGSTGSIGIVTGGGDFGFNASPIWSGGLTREQRSELFKTSEKFELVRGRDSSFPLVLKNPFDGALENVSISVSGYLSKYIHIVPEHLDYIGANESFTFQVLIEAPKYFNTGRYDLDFTISGVVSRTSKSHNKTVVSVTNMEEDRSFVLFVHDLDRKDAEALLNDSSGVVSEMKREGLAVKGVSEMLEQARSRLKNSDYESVRDIALRIDQSKEAAFSVRSEISALESVVADASRREVDTPDTVRLLNLAKTGFARGDFAAAKARLEEARLTYALETKGEFSVGYFIRENPRMVIAAVAGLFLLYFLVFLNVRYVVLADRIKKLRREESILIGLMKTIQRECFEEKKLSMEEYKESMQQYENRLGGAVNKLIEAETLKANILHIGSEESRLMRERERLLSEIKKT